MIGWFNHPLHPEPMTDKCGSVYVVPIVPIVPIDKCGSVYVVPIPIVPIWYRSRGTDPEEPDYEAALTAPAG